MARHHKDWITGFEEVGQGIQSPKIFLTWSAISCLSWAVRNQVHWRQETAYIWYPNLFVILVANPGVGKSAIKLAARIMLEATGRPAGPNQTTSASMLKEMFELRSLVPMERGASPVESCGMWLPRDELGNFMDPTDELLLSILTELFDGDLLYRKTTKTQGFQELTNPWIGLLGGCTPAWLRGNMPIHTFEAGFGSRCIFVEGQLVPTVDMFPDGNVQLEEWRLRYAGLVADLKSISEDYVGTFEIPVELRPEFNDRANLYRHRAVKEYNGGPFAGYLTRKIIHLTKIAMICNLSRGGDMVLEVQDLERAEQILEHQEHRMHRIFHNVARSEHAHTPLILLQHIQNHGPTVDENIVFRLVMGRHTLREVQEALGSLEKAGYINRVGRNITLTDKGEAYEL
jgi:hypothetical protein